MKQLFKVPFALTVLSVALVGCSTLKKSKDTEVKPNPVPQITASASLRPVFRTQVSASPKHDPYHLQLVQHGGVYYRVDPKGDVIASQAGRQIWANKVSNGLSAGVAVSDEIVVVGNQQGELFALDRKTGKTLWKSKLTASLLRPSLIQQQRVISVANDGKVFAHHSQTGQILWTFDLPSHNLTMRGYAKPILLDERTVLLASSTAYVYAVDLITGVPLWQRRVAFNEGRGEIQRMVDVNGEPIMVNNKMVTVSYQGLVTVIDLSNEEVLWSNKSSSLNRASADEQAVYVSETDGTLNAYDLNTGRLLWDNKQLANRKLSNPVRLGRYLIVGDYEGLLHIIEPSSGKIIGRANTAGQVRNLDVQNNQLFVATDKGELSVWQP